MGAEDTIQPQVNYIAPGLATHPYATTNSTLESSHYPQNETVTCKELKFNNLCCFIKHNLFKNSMDGAFAWLLLSLFCFVGFITVTAINSVVTVLLFLVVTVIIWFILAVVALILYIGTILSLIVGISLLILNIIKRKREPEIIAPESEPEVFLHEYPKSPVIFNTDVNV